MLEKLCFNNPFGESLHYMKYTPNVASENGKCPLVILLHGYGERGPRDGSEIDRVVVHGYLKYVINDKKEYPFMIVAPQCPNDNFWGSYMESLNRFLDHLIDNNDIDIDRIYLTGLSMGGTATWLWSQGAADRFAAIAPVCGEGITWYASRLANLPIWTFHGDCDETVNPHETLEMTGRINKNGGNAKFTILPGVKHNAWDYVYSNDELADWFLSHKRTK